VIKHLPSKLEAPSPNPSTAKKTKIYLQAPGFPPVKSGHSPHMPNKEARLKAEKGYTIGRGKESTHPIFTHLLGTDMRCRFK
jgi:hypothetical protein